MATVFLNQGVSWDNLPVSTTRKVLDRDELVYNLGYMRSQWAEACGGDLSHVTLDLGMLFDDIVNLCGGFPGHE